MKTKLIVGAISLAILAGCATNPKSSESARNFNAITLTINLDSKGRQTLDSIPVEAVLDRGGADGVPARLLRIGFVGETGWEIHYPACYGEFLWETLLEAGKDFGIAPFGVEAQRILRLEKKHVIVGQDTDALSNPFEADMAWVVKFEKEDFIGKPGLLAARSQGIHNQLVGFVAEELVAEGSAVVVNQKPVGRVTSARISPGQKRCVGLAWVPHDLSSEGTIFSVHNNGGMVAARVHHAAFYDPDGLRLKE